MLRLSPNRQETIMADPQQWIAGENISRFEKQLAMETDPEKRQVLEELLAQERARAFDRDVSLPRE